MVLVWEGDGSEAFGDGVGVQEDLERLARAEDDLAACLEEHGASSEAAIDKVQATVRLCNSVALRLSGQGFGSLAEETLSKAMTLTEAGMLLPGSLPLRRALRVETLSNVSCAYMQAGRPRAARRALARAVRLERTGAAASGRGWAPALANMCAVLSRLGKHTKAVRLARKAVELLEGAGGC
ncbi:unnamed protein product [Ostreobium quekettii]|uniref:Tetratricopeptide repeat n=1 Tax=Ostreobium quekettii TaxID=121088 RepID=A0A8S1IZF1_9CHLO|nr:unnamed protein product [Ostreobium quekettii]